MRRVAVAVAVLLGLVVPARAATSSDLASSVDPFIGTVAPGFVFPGASVPFGMVQNSPDTDGEFAYSGYLYHDALIRGFSLVHLNGPGVRKAGDIPFMPFVGPLPSTEPRLYGSTFDHANEEASPGYYRVLLQRYATNVELTAATRAGMQRYTFPPTPEANVLVDVARSIEGLHNGSLAVTAPDELSGTATGRYTVHFVARFDRPFTRYTALGSQPGGYVTFDALTDRDVTVKIGISFVDVEGARRNLAAETGDGFDFEGMRAAARSQWNDVLSTVRVTGGTELERRSFYTALFHAQQHPNVFSDVDGRYIGFDNAVHVAEGRTQYANFSSWDTYKAQNQLLAMLQPERYSEMLLSLLADYREGGKLPRWGEQNFDASHMSGDPAIPMIVDGFCRGLLPEPHASQLYDAMKELVTVHRPPELAALGYLPDRAGTTLEYGGADFALALMADRLGLTGERDQWLKQSLNYRNILDPETRWIRPRHADGSWLTPFDPMSDEGFQEGTSWQYSWLAPHDARGLYDGMGGDGVAVERLNTLFAAPPEVQTKATVFGIVYRTNQHAPGNEHDIQVPWMYPFAGQPWRSQDELREIQQIFRATPDGLPGNDDLGSLSAWHVFSALGFGPVIPGAPFYVVGSPVFERAVLDLPGSKDVTIEAPGASLVGKYVQSATLGDEPLDRSWLTHGELRKGGTLRLSMGSQPSSWAAAGARPPSVSDSTLDDFGCAP